jgi:hypothetical protein
MPPETLFPCREEVGIVVAQIEIQSLWKQSDLPHVTSLNIASYKMHPLIIVGLIA